jgi:hypothetical protein
MTPSWLLILEAELVYAECSLYKFGDNQLTHASQDFITYVVETESPVLRMREGTAGTGH